MANYRINKDNVLTGGPWPIVATGAQADDDKVFLEFQKAKAAGLRLIDNEVARLKELRMVLRSMKAKDAKLEEHQP